MTQKHARARGQRRAAAMSVARARIAPAKGHGLPCSQPWNVRTGTRSSSAPPVWETPSEARQDLSSAAMEREVGSATPAHLIRERLLDGVGLVAARFGARLGQALGQLGVQGGQLGGGVTLGVVGREGHWCVSCLGGALCAFRELIYTHIAYARQQENTQSAYKIAAARGLKEV